MKKILAAIVEYKLTKNDLNLLIQKITTGLNDIDASYSGTLKDNMLQLTKEINETCHQETFSSSDEEHVIDVLKEMELLIVDYLSQSTAAQTNDCILH